MSFHSVVPEADSTCASLWPARCKDAPLELCGCLRKAEYRAKRGGCILLRGSWDLVTGVKVTMLIISYLTTPIKVLITLLTKSHDPPSRP